MRGGVVAAPRSNSMSDVTDDPAYRLFAARFEELRRGRRTETLLTVAIVGLLVLVSIVDTEFYPSRIVAGLPRIGEYFGKLFSVVPERGADPVPVLALSHLFGGVKAAAVAGVLVLPHRHLRDIVVADRADGGPGHRDGLHRRLRPVVSRRAQSGPQPRRPLGHASCCLS